MALRSLGDVRSLEHSANSGAVATRGLASDQNTSASPDSSAHFHRKVIILKLDHNTVLKTAPPSVLMLPVDWPPTKVPAQHSLGDSATLGDGAACELATD
jgi:hypothetical protein